MATYRERVAHVVVVPHDPYIRTGGRIEYDRLSVENRHARLLVCTAVADALATRDDPAGD